MVTKYKIEYSSIPYSHNKIDEILNKARDGIQPDKEEAILLIKSHKRDLKKIISVASDIRDKGLLEEKLLKLVHLQVRVNCLLNSNKLYM